MGHWEMNLYRTQYLIIIIIFGAFIITSAYAVATITLSGDVIITGNLDVSGPITGTAIDDLDQRLSLLEGG
jgi:hypothetical protein